MIDAISEVFHRYGRCADLTASEKDKLSAMGVFGPSIDYREDGQQFQLKAARVQFTQDGLGPWFDFPEGINKGTKAFIIACRNERGDIADLAAWIPQGDRVALWLGNVSMLNEQACTAPRLDGKLWVRDGVLDWLRHDRTGVVVVHAERARPVLTAASPVAVKSTEHRNKLMELWRPPVVHVFDQGQAQSTLEAVA